MSLKELTKAEEAVMKQVWHLQKATVKEIAALMPDPKPAYTTVATVLKVLKDKGFVEAGSAGNVLTYFPLVKEDDYRRFAFDKVFSTYFDGSYENLVSFLVEEKRLDEGAYQRLLEAAKKLKKK
ncbi:BlaI/MecI/CopY family transcriptional regulator [Terrimonas sp. NA20]|uniref:BlaI/MecI/CopY family transcriptional regulator n=1 Tax=Terrimonas ginsenosidimutans TaxID=2908004 RepID=A0ABS9KNH7_9BACT|nr:BlaI/MecI/CopY family transcriptional regulator [Terrimonas ginsenosidimutans]MCG2613877.1 BlaI/MecI/CopY family transcriptional regulator [Terrimonas ginsenosidimutans]